MNGLRTDQANPRAVGTNPRAKGTNPRAVGTNPLAANPERRHAITEARAARQRAIERSASSMPTNLSVAELDAIEANRAALRQVRATLRARWRVP